MAAELPASLKQAIAARLDGVSRNDLAARSLRISDGYRGGATSTAVIASSEDVTAYVVTRMPATFAALSAAMNHTRAAAPTFAPRAILDVGAGPGTASFAATEAWPEISSVTMLDGNRHFINAAGDLAAGGHPALAASTRVMADATRMGDALPTADLVIAGYALAEINERNQKAFIAALWRATTGVLLIVEPGTPDGFARIRAARAALIDTGGTISGPCPHALPCPIIAPDWCHFAERLPRSRDHRLAKVADAPFEDEKYSWVAVARPSVTIATYDARVLAPPYVSKGGMRLKLCTEAGVIAERVIAKRDKAEYAAHRRLWWGDALDRDGLSETDRP